MQVFSDIALYYAINGTINFISDVAHEIYKEKRMIKTGKQEFF